MTVVHKSRKVRFTCEQMFALVNAVENYQGFLPYCSRSEVHHRDSEKVQATLTIMAAGIQKSFTTLNRLQDNKMIEIRLLDGPFEHLEGFWRFDVEPDFGCMITFDLEFEFSSRMIGLVLGPVFEQIANKMVDAFCEEAERQYA